MSACNICGRDNRPGARFCRYCAAPLLPLQTVQPAMSALPLPVHTTSSEEAAGWLAATLIPGHTSSSVSQQATRHTMPLAPLPCDYKEEGMEQSPPAIPSLFGGRYELRTTPAQGSVEVVDHEPWRRCWACGSTENQPGESFCTNCGAALEMRTYRGFLTPSDTPNPLALITTVKDEFARSLLPPVRDQLEESGYTLVVLATGAQRPIELPLDELTAFRIGYDLARLLSVLHQQGLALGRVNPADLTLLADGHPQLLQAPELRRVHNTEELHTAVESDLQNFARVLEALASTPRTTQRLDLDEDDQATLTLEALPPEDDEATLDTLLRQIRTGVFKDAHILSEHLDTLISERTRPRALRQFVGSCSDKGMLRDLNEDSLLRLTLCLNNRSQDYTRGLYIVADGMGGHAAGEVASCMAVRYASEVILSEYMSIALDPGADYDEQHMRELMKRAVLHANEAIRQTGRQQGNDMGTTITMALVVGDRAMIANVGDSRTYLYREGKLRRVSRDHSLVMRLVELGQLTDEDIYTHPQRNAVLRSLGDQAEIEVDVFAERLQPNDALLLCSDGQWEMTHDPEMEALLARYPDSQLACQELIRAANQAGGEDNITSILVRFEAV